MVESHRGTGDSVPSGVLGMSEGHGGRGGGGGVLFSPPGLCPWYLVSCKVLEIILSLVVRGTDLNSCKPHLLSSSSRGRRLP